MFTNEDKVNLLQDTFLLAYKGSIDYSETLAILRSLVNSKMDQYVLWRTFEWHWENLANLIEYSLLCRMNYPAALSRATSLFKTIPCDYFVHNNRDEIK